MKRIMVTILAFAFLFAGAAYSETGQDIQPGGKDQALTLPNAADYFGASVDSGYLSIATDFSGNYDLFRPATLDQIERYCARMEALGYAVNVAETKDEVQMWLFSSDEMPFLVLAFYNRQAALCLKDDIVSPWKKRKPRLMSHYLPRRLTRSPPYRLRKLHGYPLTIIALTFLTIIPYTTAMMMIFRITSRNRSARRAMELVPVASATVLAFTEGTVLQRCAAHVTALAYAAFAGEAGGTDGLESERASATGLRAVEFGSGICAPVSRAAGKEGEGRLMKRTVLALALALVVSFGFVVQPALGEKNIDNLFSGSDSSFTLPNEASYFGSPSETGTMDLPDGFAWTYTMYSSVDNDALARYRTRLGELGYQETQTEQNGVTIFTYARGSKPVLTLLTTDGSAAVCQRDDLSYREEEAVRTESGKSIDELFMNGATEVPEPAETPNPAAEGYAIVEVDGVEITLRQEGVATLAEKYMRHDDGPSGYETIPAYTANFCWYDQHGEKMGTLTIQIWTKALEGDRFMTETDAANGWLYNELSYVGTDFSGSAGVNENYDPYYNPSYDFSLYKLYASKSYPYGSEYTIDITSLSQDEMVYEGTFSGYLTDDRNLFSDAFSDYKESSPFYLTNGEFRMVVSPEK